MDFFTINILEDGGLLLYIALFVSVITFVFLFLRKKQSEPRVSYKISENELEIKLRAYERLTIFLDRIEPIGMCNRLQLHDINNVGELKSVLIKNIITEYEYNISQQIYVSDELWKLIELVKNKIINNIASVSDSLSNKDDVNVFFQKMLKESLQNNLMIKKAQKLLKKEVRILS
ncbi:MAG: hypothetical protein CMP56_03010 [Flavobacteriales bacterium]|nr:hypothetical protein [Flavobacteriales bacterium]|tara:strand:+ start:748 stop:1272 length:525 start_codon:yes stop_codon:yes gene_type:complete